MATGFSKLKATSSESGLVSDNSSPIIDSCVMSNCDDKSDSLLKSFLKDLTSLIT